MLQAMSTVPAPAAASAKRGGAAPTLRRRTRATFDSLRNRDFRTLWIGNLSSSFAMNMQQIARGWLIYALTESAMALTWVTLSFMIPQVGFALFGGVLADRMRKRTIIAVAQGVNCVATLVMAWIILTGRVDFWAFIWFGIVNGTVLALSMPARQAFIPEIVGEQRLFNAMALNTASWNLSRILGPALAGLLIAMFAAGNTSSTFGVGIVYLVIAALYLLAVGSALRVGLPGAPRAGAGDANPFADVAEGLGYVWRDRAVFGLIMMSILPFLFGMPMITLLPAFNHDVLGGGPDALGYINATMGIGAIIGSLVLAPLGDAHNKGHWQFAMCMAWGVFICVFSLTSEFLLALATVALVGFASSVFMSMNRSLIQLRISQQMRGRVMSIDMMSHGLMPLGILPIGWISDHYGIRNGLLAAGAILAVMSVVMWLLLKTVRRIDTGHEHNHD